MTLGLICNVQLPVAAVLPITATLMVMKLIFRPSFNLTLNSVGPCLYRIIRDTLLNDTDRWPSKELSKTIFTAIIQFYAVRRINTRFLSIHYLTNDLK